MANTITFIEENATNTISVLASESVQVQSVTETVEARQVASQALEVTLDAIGQPITVEVTGDVGVVARLAAQVVEAERSASASALAAALSEAGAANSEEYAGVSEENAASSATDAARSAVQANDHRIIAENKAGDAASSAAFAEGSKQAAADSAASAQSWAGSAQISAEQAGTEAGKAETSATDAAGSASAAATSAQNAAGSAGQAEGHASDAGHSAETATTQAGLATSAKTDAAIARDAAINARTGAETAQANAAASATAAASSATTAQTAKAGASAAQQKAFQWANHPEDQLLPGETQYSSAHWAAKAAESAATASGQVEFLGSWDAAAKGTPPTPANSARYVIVSDGVVDGKNVYVNDFITYSVPDAQWFVTPGSGNVASVNGHIGAVALDYGDFAGAQSIALDNGLGILGKDVGGSHRYLIRARSEGYVQVGESAYPVRLFGNSVPQWYNGSETRALLTTGGGQEVASHLGFSSHHGSVGIGGQSNGYHTADFRMQDDGSGKLAATIYVDVDQAVNGFQVRQHNSGSGGWSNLFRVLPDRRGFLGTNEILHTGGGQAVSGTTTLDKISFPRTSVEHIEFHHPVSGLFSVGFKDDYLRFRGSGNDNPAGIRLDDYDETVVQLSRHGVSQFKRGLNASAISEGDTALSDKYLGINARAADSAKLAGKHPEHFIYGKNGQGTLGVAELGENGWNDVIKSGFYNGDAQPNDPGGNASGWYWGIHASHENGNHYGWTLVASNDSNPTWYLRGVRSGTWGDWHQIITSKGGQTIHGGLEVRDLTISNTSPALELYESDQNNPGNNHRLTASGGHVYLQSEGNIRFTGYNAADLTGLKAKFGGVYHDILHSGGGQSIGGLTTFNSANYGQHINIVKGGESWSITPSTAGSLDVYRNSGSGTAKIAVPGLNANGPLTQSGHQVWHDGNTSGVTPASAPELGVVDLNSYQTPGFYFQTANADATNGTNYPAARAGSLVVQASAGVTQQYYTYNFLNSDAPDFYFRGYYSGNWSPWRKVLHSGSQNASVAGSLGIGVAPSGNLANGKGIALGDNDTGIRQNGSGIVELWANNTMAMQVTGSYALLPDNQSLHLGSQSDARLYHSGSNTHFNNYTGDLYVRNLKHGGRIYFQAEDSSGNNEACIYVDGTGSAHYVRLFYGGSEKLITQSYGAKTNGTHKFTTDWEITSDETVKTNWRKLKPKDAARALQKLGAAHFYDRTDIQQRNQLGVGAQTARRAGLRSIASKHDGLYSLRYRALQMYQLSARLNDVARIQQLERAVAELQQKLEAA
ncbi:pyocin knob domain-containing protein [Microbulbifer sp. 2304DJ12-6]|uniref:pyocin knob domain-containing protein n=1 Tax=Microbulbifer sp. 2304DJ12-6 TaxID=3233340 RepID=UPI0039AF70A4